MGLGAALADQKPDPRKLDVMPIAVEASPIASFDRFGAGGGTGKLVFRGGLTLTSSSEHFGGWSGLALDARARTLVAVSDSGIWMTGDLAYEGVTLRGLEKARIGPLKALDGAALRRGRERDAEAVAILAGTPHDGRLLVAFEQKSRIARYSVTGGTLGASESFLDLPAATRKLKRNFGFEAMTVVRGGPNTGKVIAFAERLLDGNRDHTGWIWQGAQPRELKLSNLGDFDVTDVATDDQGTLFVLERRFRWTEGVRMRLRRIAAADVQPGRTLDGEVLLEADMQQQIDNMEGLAVTPLADGDTLLTMISDDNFNRFLQRTVVLQFVLPASQTAKARPQE